MDSASALRELDEAIRERSILKHPFYQAWNAGMLTREMLKNYACQYDYFVRHFPRMVSAVHSNTPHLAIRQELLLNLFDERYEEVFGFPAPGRTAYVGVRIAAGR